MIYVGIDDTDTQASRGTGHLARLIAAHLTARYPIVGVTRHQLLLDPRIHYTAKNSCAAIHIDATGLDLKTLYAQIRPVMQSHHEPGSDPGLAIAGWVPLEVIAFGKRAKQEVLTQQEAFELVDGQNLVLEGLGGTMDGVIGALAGVGLAGHGSDGRYVSIGTVRELVGLKTTETILSAGVHAIQTLTGENVDDGLVLADKLRPARRNSQAVLFVEKTDTYWMPLKLD